MIKGCVHAHIKGRKIMNVFSHLTGLPDNGVVHLSPDNVFFSADFAINHPDDINEIYVKEEGMIFELGKKNIAIENIHEPCWGQWFLDKITLLKEKIEYILEVKTVRELWLQGELYLHTSDEQEMHLNYNAGELVGSGHIDFYSNKIPLCAELKICGRGYQSKVIDGSIIKDSFPHKKIDNRVVPDLDYILNKYSEDKKSKENSILMDVSRLLSIDDAYDKYMVLIIPTDPGIPQDNVAI